MFDWLFGGKKKKHEKDLKAFYESDEFNPEQIIASHNRDFNGKIDEDTDSLIAKLSDAILRSPMSIEYLIERAFLYARSGENDKAIEDCNKAIELNSATIVAYHLRGTVYYRKGDMNAVIADYSVVISNSRKPHAATYFRRGLAYERIGNIDNALTDLSIAIQLDPKFSYGYFQRARIKQQVGDWDSAVNDYSRAIRFPSDIDRSVVHRIIAGVYYSKGDYENAIRYSSLAIEINSTFVAPYTGRSLAYYKKDDFDNALADAEEAIRLNPNEAFAYSTRGYARKGKGDLDGALADVEQAFRLEPDHTNAYYLRGLIHELQGNFEAALTDIEKYLEIRKKDGNIHSIQYKEAEAKITELRQKLNKPD